jgi:RHS repeat-associated protein
VARPSGWDILGLDGDPTPGVVESVQALAKEFGDFAHDVESAYRSLNSFGSDTTALQWVGQTADAFKGQFGPLPGRLQKLYTSYSEASDALSAYAPQLQAAQSKADSALRQAQDANADLQRANTTANNAAADLKTAQQNHAATPNPQAVTDAQNAHNTAQTNLTNAKAHMADLTKQANDAYNDRITAAKTCAGALHNAQSDGIHNRSWWDHLGEDMANIGGEIANIANEIAPILDVLALATSWIPGVDVITAALAEADNIIALVGTGMQIAGDAMQGHWGDALMGVGMLGLQFVGGKAIEKVGGKLMDKYGGQLLEKIGSRGNKLACEGGDPVDVVSGRMLTSDTDLVLPGVLPLFLRRSYSSGYEVGRLFGPGWSSTLDIRLSVNAAGIHLTGDDAQVLHYPVPAAGQSVVPEHGSRWPLEWDREADEIRITTPATGLVMHFPVAHFAGEDGQIRDLMALTDRNGNRLDFLRDSQGNPTGVEHSGGYRVAIDTTATGGGLRVSRIRVLDGSDDGVTVRTFQYDEPGRLAGVVDSTGEPFRYEHDDADRITAWTDRLGYRYVYEYGEDGRVVRGTGDGGYLSATFVYDDDAQANTVTDSLGQPCVYRYDESGNVVAISDPLGNTLVTEYDARGLLIAGTDAIGRTTRREYDEHGNAVRMLRADGTEITGRFAGPAQPIQVTLPDGTAWHYTYDDRGNTATVTDPAGAASAFVYDDRGAVAESTDALGLTTRVTNDGAGLPVEVVDPAGAVTRIRRDAFGRIAEVHGADNEFVTTEFTVEGRPLRRTTSDDGTATWTYDLEQHVIEHVNGLGAVTRSEYGPFDKVVARTDAAGVRHAFTYDTELKLVRVTNPAGRTWDYDHDAAGNLTGERDFTGRVQRYAHDAVGQLTTRVNGAGQVVRLERNPMGQVVRQRADEGETVFAYDVAGRLLNAAGPGSTLAYTYDEAGRPVTETVDGRSTVFDYDAAGRRIGRITPSGAVSEWDFDSEVRRATLMLSGRELAFDFDGAGHETVRTVDGGARLTQEFDAAGRLAGQRIVGQQIAGGSAGGFAGDTAVAAPSVLFERSYSYRADGVPTAVGDSLRGTRRYQLDSAGRVTAVQAPAWTETYSYDTSGNVAQSIGTGGRSAGDDSPEAPAFDGPRIRRSGRTHYDYDAQGRTVRALRQTLSGQRREWHYSWDSDDRMTQVRLPDGTVWQYTYDPSGRRTGKTRLAADGTPAERVTFSWDGDRLVEQVTESPDGLRTALVWDYELGGGWRPVAQRRRSWAADAPQETIDEAFHTIVTDLVGTPTELVAPDGSIDWHTTTSLYGTPITTSSEHTADCPLRFPGQFYDAETGLHYNVQRYYDPERGSYLSPDPLGLAPAPNDQAYVANPMVESDPLGLLCMTALQQIKDRTDDLHGLLDVPYGQRENSVAIIRAMDKNGDIHHVVGWSGSGDLDPRIAAQIGKNGSLTNEIAADPFTGATQLENHAETTALNTIRDRGWTPLGGAANRPVCPWCQNSIVHTPFDAKVGTATLVGPAKRTAFTPPVGKMVQTNQKLATGKSGGWLYGQSMFTW